jgi:benzoyl-CoA reductase/2-hydroxyglutaryl-CoA dehydratase subunit BcrC/BadD/HgdB
MTDGPEAIAILIQEVKKRIDDGVGVVDKGAPRVMLFSGTFSDASIVRMIEDTGLAVAATLVSAPVPRKEREITHNTLGEEIAEREMRLGIYHSNYGLANRWIKAVEELGIDGSIWGYQFNCRPLAQPSHFLPKFVAEQTGVPCLSLEMDYYDSRTYSAGSLRTRVETFAEILRARKASAKT